MAVNLKTNFKDGDNLFAQELNNNFTLIQAALGTYSSISWEDSTVTAVIFYKGDTEAITARDVIVGQILFDTTLEKIYLDTSDGRKEIYELDLSKKQDTLVSGTTIKTVNGTSILGEGNIEIKANQYDEMPTASSTYNNVIAQYTGETTDTYTNGYFYKCSETDSNDWSWKNINTQANINDVQVDGASVVKDNIASIDLSSKQNVMQYETMPDYHSFEKGILHTKDIVQYLGETNDTYTHGYFYRLVSKSSEYGLMYYDWERINVQPSGEGAGSVDDVQVNGTSVVNADGVAVINNLTTQYTTLPLDESLVDKIVQYSGTTTSDYTNGYFYKLTNDSELKWERINIQPAAAGTITDVQVNGTSVVTDEVANIDISGKFDASKISKGTSEPTGGTDGDIYFKYEE